MVGQINLCRFKREDNSPWEIGLNTEIDGLLWIFDINMEKPKDIYDYKDLDVFQINMCPIIEHAQKNVDWINEIDQSLKEGYYETKSSVK